MTWQLETQSRLIVGHSDKPTQISNPTTAYSWNEQPLASELSPRLNVAPWVKSTSRWRVAEPAIR